MFNMGVIDRIVRVLIALVLGVLIYLKVINGILAIVLGVIGGIFILTSIIGICPLYLPFKINTKKK